MATQYRLTVVSRITGQTNSRTFAKADDALHHFSEGMEVKDDYVMLLMAEVWRDDYDAWHMGRILHCYVSEGVIVASRQSAMERMADRSKAGGPPDA